MLFGAVNMPERYPAGTISGERIPIQFFVNLFERCCMSISVRIFTTPAAILVAVYKIDDVRVILKDIS